MEYLNEGGRSARERPEVRSAREATPLFSVASRAPPSSRSSLSPSLGHEGGTQWLQPVDTRYTSDTPDMLAMRYILRNLVKSFHFSLACHPQTHTL